MRLAERLSRVEPRRQGLLLQLRRGGQRGRDQARAQGPPGGDVVVVYGAFHGRTYGALSATPQESKQAPFAPLVPGFRAVDPTPEAIVGAVDDEHRRRAAGADPGRDGRERALRGDAPGRARGLRRARGGARVRRGPVRDGPHRHALGLRADRRRPGRDHGRQGARRRPADRRAHHGRHASATCSSPATTAPRSPAAPSSPRPRSPRSR